jgi:DNA-directed RNA polymerase subunit RPC12/RpoP
MRCSKNGAAVRTSPGTIVEGDAYCCPTCGSQIVVGFGSKQREYAAQHVVADLTTTREEI